MRELALNILDIAENSVAAGASLIEIGVNAEPSNDKMEIFIRDNGKGMSEQMLAKVTDPFTTTRTTRKVGMGLPLFKFSAESAGGNFTIASGLGDGTCVSAVYQISHVDRMPLGDYGGVALQLITMNPKIDFVIGVRYDKRKGVLDTREVREMLGEDIPLDTPEVRVFLKDYIKENITDLIGGRL